MLRNTFWTDPRIVQMGIEERVDEIAVAVMSITGIMANRDEAISGIYEIHREGFSKHGLNERRATQALNYFNSQQPEFLEYDFQNHILNIKKFFKYQTNYKPGVKVISGLMNGFKETFQKVPRMWEEFSERNNDQIRGLLPKLAEAKEESFAGKVSRKDQVKFIEELADLKNNFPSPNPKPALLVKLKENQRTI